MDPQLYAQIRQAVSQGMTAAWWLSSSAMILTLIVSLLGVYLIAYLKKKGEGLATKEEFDTLLAQVKQTTDVTTRIQAEYGTLKAYNETRGQHLATKDDSQEILRQLRITTTDTETIKAEISTRATRAVEQVDSQRALVQRYLFQLQDSVESLWHQELGVRHGGPQKHSGYPQGNRRTYCRRNSHGDDGRGRIAPMVTPVIGRHASRRSRSRS